MVSLLAASAWPNLAGAIIFEDPANYRVKKTWSAKQLGIPASLGGLLFSPDGGTLYVVGSAEESDSAVYAVPVKRDSITNEVVKLGPKSAVTKFFDGDASTVGLTAGLEYGPAETLFFSYWDANYLGQRPGAGSGAETLFFLEPLGVPESVAGITFSPYLVDPATGFGQMQVSSWDGDGIYDMPLTPASGGIFTPGMAVPFVTLPFEGTGALQYVPNGPQAGNMMYVNYSYGEIRVLTIDPATGLPIDRASGQPTRGTSDPIDELFASGLGEGPWGLEFDETAGDFFVTTFDGDPDNTIIQIGGFPPSECVVSRATAWANGSKPGRVTYEGVVPDLDVSGGLTFTVTDASSLNQSGSVAAGDCQLRQSGKIKCVFDDPLVNKKRVKAVFEPTGAAGTYRFKIFMNRLDVPQPQVGPLSLSISTPGGTLCQAANTSCAQRNSKLVCRN